MMFLDFIKKHYVHLKVNPGKAPNFSYSTFITTSYAQGNSQNKKEHFVRQFWKDTLKSLCKDAIIPVYRQTLKESRLANK